MKGKQVLTIITLLTVGLIISIYIGDMISCLITDSPIPIVEVVIVFINRNVYCYNNFKEIFLIKTCFFP